MHERLKIAPHIVEAVLNHISGAKKGVAGVYNRAQYLEEKRAAAQRLYRPYRPDHRGRSIMTDHDNFLEQLRQRQDNFLEQCRERYEGGDKSYLPYSLNYCMTNNLPIPPWLATA